jgi:glycosyltransferase involved in cell wall biosynthesis
MIGTRGVPARYSGVETVVEALGVALVERGHEVTVYCRRDRSAGPAEYRGMRLRYVPTVPGGGIAAFVHAFVATLDAIPRRYDVIHYHAVGPGLQAVIARATTRAGVLTTVHGRDDKRAKWGRGTMLVLRAGVWVSARVPHRTLVVSKELADEYLREYDRETDVVPNAVVAPRRVSAGDTLASLGLEPRRYALSVGRLVPEKGVHVLAEAYAEAKTDIPLVIVGEPSGTEEYVAGIRARHEGDRVRFVGAHYAEAFEELMSSARLFVTASELEGLPTSLIEAGLYELPIVATDIGPHAEVLSGGPSESWMSPVGDVSGLTAAIEAALAGGELHAAARLALRDRLLARHAPAASAQAHESVYASCARPAARPRAGAAQRVSDVPAMDADADQQPGLRVTHIDHPGGLGELRAAWDQLCADRPTVQWPWIAQWWWQYRGHDQLAVLAVWSGPRLVGVAPWYVSRSLGGPSLIAIGVGEVATDHGGLIADPAHAADVGIAIADHLLGPFQPGWRRLVLGTVTKDDEAIGALLHRLRSAGMIVDRQPDGHDWSIPLPSSFDEYLGGLSRSGRHRLRRLSRAIAARGGRWTEVSNQDELGRVLPLVEALHQARRRSLGQRGRFESRSFARFSRAVARQLLDEGHLRLLLLEIDGRPAAFDLSVSTAGSTFSYQTGFDPAFARLRGGQVVLAEVIARAIARGDRVLDLGRGDEEYKAHWRAVPVALESVQVATRHPAAMARFLVRAGFDRFARSGAGQIAKDTRRRALAVAIARSSGDDAAGRT